MSSPLAATLVPAIPPELGQGASAEEDGILVEVELQRNPMPAAQASWVKVKVTNRGRTNVTWLHDGCASVATASGSSSVAWSMGEAQPGNLDRFKTYALGGNIVDPPSPFASFDFVPEAMLGKGSYGCADIGIEETLKPGESRRETRWWSGFTAQNRALPPAGPATVVVSAGLYWRGGDSDHLLENAITFEFPIAAWVEASDSSKRLSPAEVVDAALTDADFARFVGTQKIGDGREEIAWYHADGDRWEIGIMPWYEMEPPRIHGLVVDARTGDILGPLDRAWSRDLDGMP